VENEKSETTGCSKTLRVEFKGQPLLEVRYLSCNLTQSIANGFRTSLDQLYKFKEHNDHWKGKFRLEDLRQLKARMQSYYESNDWVNRAAKVEAYVSAHFPNAAAELLAQLFIEGMVRSVDKQVSADDVDHINALQRSVLRARLRARSRGGRSRLVDATEEQRIELSRGYDIALARWSMADKLYNNDPAGALRYAHLEDTEEWLLKDFQKRGTKKCKPNRLAHFDAAVRSGLAIRHKGGKRKGQLVSLSTLEKERKAGDLLCGITRKTSRKRTTKGVTATAK